MLKGYPRQLKNLTSSSITHFVPRLREPQHRLAVAGATGSNGASAFHAHGPTCGTGHATTAHPPRAPACHARTGAIAAVAARAATCRPVSPRVSYPVHLQIYYRYRHAPHQSNVVDSPASSPSLIRHMHRTLPDRDHSMACYIAFQRTRQGVPLPCRLLWMTDWYTWQS